MVVVVEKDFVLVEYAVAVVVGIFVVVVLTWGRIS